MASTSALLNKPLRQFVSPLLREAGFQKTEARNAWSWQGDAIWVFNIRAVGNYFSLVTGWPPGSVGTWLGVFFTFTPKPSGMRSDASGRALPHEHMCHMRTHLDCALDQTAYVRGLNNPAERQRNDLWWVEPNGGNAAEVAADIAAAVGAKALTWFRHIADPRNALAVVEGTRDCFAKFSKAALLAHHLGDEERARHYGGLAEAEARRSGLSLDRATWTGI